MVDPSLKIKTQKFVVKIRNDSVENWEE